MTLSDGSRAGPPDSAVRAHEWRWSRSVLTSADAARLASDHMRFLGFCGVFVRPAPHGVGNVVAIDAVALAVGARHDAAADSSSFIAAGLVAAPGRSRLVYDAVGSQEPATRTDLHDTALFRVRPDGAVVAANEHARSLATGGYAPPARRTSLGALTLYGRQVRAAAWLEQIARPDFLDSAVSTDTFIIARSDAASSCGMVDALMWLRAARDPEASLSERVHALVSAETALKRAASTLGVRLH